MKLFKSLMFVIVFNVSGIAIASESVTAPNNSVNFTMPITTDVQPIESLTVMIPSGFRALESLQDFTSGKTKIIEYIPQNDPDYKWTQIITANQFASRGVQANQLINFMVKRFKTDARNTQILEQTTTQHKNYERSCAAIDYEINKRHEMVYMCYYSGTANCVGLQYAVLWPQNSNATQEQLLSQLKQFVASHSKVVSNGK